MYVRLGWGRLVRAQRSLRDRLVNIGKRSEASRPPLLGVQFVIDPDHEHHGLRNSVGRSAAALCAAIGDRARSPCSHHRCRGRRPWHRIREQRILILGSGVADPGSWDHHPRVRDETSSWDLGPGSGPGTLSRDRVRTSTSEVCSMPCDHQIATREPGPRTSPTGLSLGLGRGCLGAPTNVYV